MKKRISAIFAIVLTLAVLASSFAMLGVNAEESATLPEGTEKVTIGNEDYTIVTADKYDAAQEVISLMAASTLGSNVTFTGKWDVNFKVPSCNEYGKRPGNYGTTLVYRNTYSGTAPGIQLDTIRSNDWCRLSVGKYSDTALWVSPASSEGAGSRAKITFTAPKAGKVVLWDNTGRIGYSHDKWGNVLLTGTPYWMWQDSAITITVEIYKNNTKLWPLNGENNVFDATKKFVNFPDLGEIEVAAGDKVYIEFTQNNTARAGMVCAPMAAYVYEEPAQGGEGGGNEGEGGEGTGNEGTGNEGGEGGSTVAPTHEKVTIGNSTYDVIVAEKYNCYDTIWDLVDEMDNYTAVDMTSSAWQFKAKFQDNYFEGYTFAIGCDSTLENGHFPSITRTTTNTAAWNTLHYQNAIAFDTTNQFLFVSPCTGSWGTTSIADLVWTAPKAGKVVIYDVLGSIAPASDVNAFKSFPNDGKVRKVQISVFKGETQIWPTSIDADNIISSATDSLVFPDLGKISVKKGDTITVRFQELGCTDGGASQPRQDAVKTDLEVAYTDLGNFGGGAAQTDASFASQVLVLVSVITVLGAALITVSVIAKKRSFN